MNKQFSNQLFSEDLKKYKTENNINQTKLAEQLDLTDLSFLSQIEQGKTYPSKEIFENFCSLANKVKDSYWHKEKEDIHFAFLKNNESYITFDETEKLRVNIETREYLNCLNKRYYEK